MDIRPQDLPELRNEAMIGQHQTGMALKQWLYLAQERGWNPDAARGNWRYEIQRLASAELFYVSPDMARLAQAASASLPSFMVEPEDLPTRSGLIFFGEDIDGGIRVVDHPGEWGEVSCTTALLWDCPDPSDVRDGTLHGVYVTAYMDRERLLAGAVADGEVSAANRIRKEPRLLVVPSTGFTIPFGQQGWERLPNDTSVSALLPILLATWMLMQQPLAVTSDVEPDRAARKRLARLGREPKSVRVIELRRPKQASGEAAESGRNYVHRWITRGHWRQQWYATRQVHRPVWIAPHVKGPEGAPMIGGEKVYAWKR